MQPFDSNDIDFDDLVRFAFGEMSTEEEQTTELLLEENPHLADVVDGILRFALDHDLRSRAAFERAWAAQMKETQTIVAQTIKKEASSKNTPKWRWYLLAGLLIGLVGIGIWKFMGEEDNGNENQPASALPPVAVAPEKPTTLPKNENDTPSKPPDLPKTVETPIQKKTLPPIAAPSWQNIWANVPKQARGELEEFWETERSSLVIAGGENLNWKKEFVAGNFESALSILDTLLLKHPEKAVAEDRYFGGVLCYLLMPERAGEAAERLKNAKGVEQEKARSRHLSRARSQMGN
jgi:hypothetical protein